MKIFNDKPWKKWKTRKITLVGSIIGIIIYIIFGILMGWSDHTIDSTLTEQVFSFAKCLVGIGGGITVTDMVIGKSGSKVINKIVNKINNEESEE